MTRLRDGSIVAVVRNYNPYLYIEIAPLGRTAGEGVCGSPYPDDCNLKREEWDIILYRDRYEDGQTVKDELQRGHYATEWNGTCATERFDRGTFTDSLLDSSGMLDAGILPSSIFLLLV